MDGIILLILLIVGVPIALFIWFAVKASNAEHAASQAADAIHHLRGRLEAIDRELLRLRQQVDAKPMERTIELPPASAHKPIFVPPSPVVQPVVPTPSAPSPPPEPVVSEPAVTPEPPPEVEPEPAPAFTAPATPVPPPPQLVLPPTLPPRFVPPPPPPPPQEPRMPSIDWEQFMGVKLFA